VPQWRRLAASGGLAPIKARRKSLHGAEHHSIGVARLNLAFDQDLELIEWAIGRERMRDIAEGILVLIEPAAAGHVDAPVDDMLAVVVARRQT
jgi:hypothetical protein